MWGLSRKWLVSIAFKRMCGVIRSVQGIVCKLSICTCCLHGLPRLGDFKISWKRAEAVLQF
jgi:hypothetical protein